MATGYTDTIKDGITFKQFVLKCARAFGACIEMRDESMEVPIPDKFEPSTYHLEALKKAEKELSEASNMSLEDAGEKALNEYNKRKNEYKESIRKNTVLEEKYNSMLKQVEKWIPPTAEHIGIKEFMTQQITSSIDFDCGDYYEKALRELKKSSGSEWKKQRIDSAVYDITYHTRELEKEKRRAEERTSWIKALRESLT